MPRHESGQFSEKVAKRVPASSQNSLAFNHSGDPNCHLPPPYSAIFDRFQDGFEAFLSYISISRNLSPHTLRAYQNDIQNFLAWMHPFLTQASQRNPRLTNPNETPKEDETESISDPSFSLREIPSHYLGFLSSQSLSRPSVVRKTSALKSFFKFLVKDQYFQSNELTLTFTRPKTPKKLPDFLTVEEVQQLFKTLDQTQESRLKVRNKAILSLLFSSGIRVGELVGLDIEDVNWEEAEIKVLGKGDRERISFMSQDSLLLLEAYFQIRPSFLEDASPPGKKDLGKQETALFLNDDGTRLSARSVHRMLHHLGEVSNLSKGIHPHIFRHTFATHLLNQGVDLRIVQELLGHVSIRSTQIYTHISTERLKKAYMNAHPRARLQNGSV
ncbi:MAG: tyrosine-type recombinase/integrase [Cyanobacteria bacterium]|nr:tyrosine-type recombinase/integrase [Cyanobacteriota bacterium]